MPDSHGKSSLDERLEALTQSVELLYASAQEQGKTIDKIIEALKRDSENIHSLARVAEIHEKRA